jgi:hypothetical protein
MKYLIIFIMLISFNVSASDLFKTKDNAILCFNKDVLNLIYSAYQLDQDKAIEMLKYAIEREGCVVSHPDLIGRLVDIDNDLYKLHLLSYDVQVWVSKRHLVK